MPPLARRTRVILALAALVAAFAAWQGVAMGATVTGATLEGAGVGNVTSTSSPGGSVLPATATVKVVPGESWTRTRVDVQRRRLLTLSRPVASNTGNHSRAGTSTESFNVTAPGPPGDYDVTFFAHSGSDCSARLPAASGFTLLRRG